MARAYRRSCTSLSGCVAVLVACGPKVAFDDGADDETTAAQTTTDTRPDPTTVSTTSTTGPSSTTTSSSGDPTATVTATTTETTGRSGPGYCIQQCQVAADCCQGQPDCPGPYPNNWVCESGGCRIGGCSSDDDCDFIGGGWICAPLDPIPSCLPACDDDSDCEVIGLPGWLCTGSLPNGNGYCQPSPDGCDGPFDPCEGFGHCDPQTGFCVCADDTECTEPGYVCTNL